MMRRLIRTFRRHRTPEIVVRAAALLDAEWYTRFYEDVARSPFDAYTHFTRYGFDEGRNPNPLFETDWYRHRYSLPAGRNCIQHYLNDGYRAGHEPSMYFDSDFYRSQAGRIDPSVSPLEHYWDVGWRRCADPHPLFDAVWYLGQRPAGIRVDEVPLVHFLMDGWRGSLSPSPAFMPGDYLDLNTDVAEAGVNAFMHYLAWGIDEGRETSRLLDGALYARRYPDDGLVRQWGAGAHYARFGRSEGRRVSRDPLAERILGYISERAEHDRRFVPTDSYGVSMSDPIDWGRRADAIVCDRHDSPRVSIIIPTLNHADDVIRCVESISLLPDSTTRRIVVVDDGSSEEQHRLLARIPGVTLVRLEQNQGFAGACQAGVDAVDSEFVLLLNNDTEVLPGWLDALVEEMDSHATTGIAGSMILRADCRLQEAGGIVWSDGTGAHYASGQSPTSGLARYRRPVDFCSGASLLIRRRLWLQVGGFDAALAPAYYEDVDLCFSARKAGFEVVYQPNSVVIHREGSTHGRGSFGLKRRQFVNRETFVEKWTDELALHDSPHGVDDWQALSVRDRRHRGHVLVCDHEHLDPTADAGSVRMDAILRGLVDIGFVVHFYPFGALRNDEWVDSIARTGVEVLESGSSLDTFLWAYRDELEFILVSRPTIMGELASVISLHAPRVPLVYDMVDAHGLRLLRKAQVSQDPEDLKNSLHSEAVERRSVRLADITIAVSQVEVDHITNVAGVPLTTLVIPTIHKSVSNIPGFDDRAGLLFVGGFQHDPNVDAAKFLVHEILPLVEERLGPVPVTIVGSRITREIEELQSQSVRVLGWVEDLHPVYASHRFVVAPMRYGAGVKGKIGEALSHGVPVVTTPVGVEGYDVVAGRDILIGETADELADLIVRGYRDVPALQQLSTNGIQAVERTAGIPVLRGQLRRLSELVEEHRRA